ncbi:MAG: aminotransferase class IV [Pirellula sp.]
MNSPSSERFLSSYALRWDSVAASFELVEASRLAMPATDLGAMHGAILVERVRTFGKRILDLQPHKARLQIGFDALGLDGRAFLQQLDSAIEELIAKTPALLNEESDASLCIVVTPGDYFSGKKLHAFAHWLPIPWRKIAHWYQFGTTLVRVHYASGAGECWPSNIKSRSRLNYYLADQDAAKRFQGGLGLLCTSRGMVADTSVANLLLVDRQGAVHSPRREDVVCGTSLERIEKMLGQQGQSIQYRDLMFEELYEASEVLLLGNTGCIWHASALQRREIGGGQAGPMCIRLQKQWCESIGFDWRAQALLKAEMPAG